MTVTLSLSVWLLIALVILLIFFGLFISARDERRRFNKMAAMVDHAREMLDQDRQFLGTDEMAMMYLSRYGHALSTSWRSLVHHHPNVFRAHIEELYRKGWERNDSKTFKKVHERSTIEQPHKGILE